MGNNDSADTELFEGLDDIYLPSKLPSIDELSDAPPIVHIKSSYRPNVLRLEDLSPKMTSSPTERPSIKVGLGSIASAPQLSSPKFISTESPVYLESSFLERPSLEVKQACDNTRPSTIIAPQERRKTSSRRTSATEPRPCPEVSSVDLSIKKKNRPGPTIPGPTFPTYEDDFSEDSTWGLSSRSSIHKVSKSDMNNWTDEWKGVKQVQGLYEDEISDTLSPRESNDFIKHKAALEDNTEHSSGRRLNPRASIRSRFSALSTLSSLSPDLPVRERSPETSSISESLHVQTFADLMPTASWASPHCKDYEDEPFDPYKLSHSRKTEKSFKYK